MINLRTAEEMETIARGGAIIAGLVTQRTTEVLVPSVISNWTGRLVLCCITMARVARRSPWQMSFTRNCTRSHALSLLSMPRSNSARSRMHPANCNQIRIAQTSFNLKGAF